MVTPKSKSRVIHQTKINPTRNMSDPVGRRHKMADDLVKEFGLDTPGVARALFTISLMRRWGVIVTPHIARNCIRHHVEQDIRLQERMAARLRSHDPVVYYMRLGNRIKIGTSTNLTNRLAAIRPEELLATEPGDTEIERARHRQFSSLRTHGEWFRHEGELAEFIDTLRAEDQGDDLPIR